MKKKERRIKHLMCKHRFYPKSKLPTQELREAKLDILLRNKKIELDVFLGVDPNSQEHKERKEVFDFYYSNALNDLEIQEIWWKTYQDQFSRRTERPYTMPKPERKDNQNPVTNTYNWGSSGGNRSSIRVPSKKRKNKYKNFLKLFDNK